MSTVISVDLGTSLVKVALFEDGKLLGAVSREAQISQPADGIAKQDADEFVKLTIDSLKQLMQVLPVQADDVAGIGFSGQMGGILAVDKDFKAITPWYTSNLDNRYLPALEQMRAIVGDRLTQLNGMEPIGSPRLWWFRDEYPELYPRIAKLLLISNYVAGSLGDLSIDDAFIDPSYLGWYGMADTANRQWSNELITALDFPRDLLPKIVPANKIIGHLSKTVADITGLKQGTPLVAGIGDAVATMIGAGSVRNGQVVDIAGSFNIFSFCTNRYIDDFENGRLQSLPGPTENHWYPMMYIAGAGLTHRWFAQHIDTPTSAQSFDEMYKQLDQGAESIPVGSNKLLFIPHMSGRACPPLPQLRGAWLGLNWSHTKAHMYRALLESIAYEYNESLQVVRAHLPDMDIQTIRIAGGGRQSQLWNQIKSDVLGIPYQQVKQTSLTNLGTAIIAGNAVGLYDNITDTAEQFTQLGDRYTVNPDNHKAYQAYSRVYNQSHEAVAQVTSQLIDI